MRNKIKELKKMSIVFWENLSLEAKETKEAAQIVAKYAKDGKITEEEEKILRQQFYDVLKVAGIGVPFVLVPGASVLLPLLLKYAKKKNIDILPSSFNNKDKNETTETNE